MTYIVIDSWLNDGVYGGEVVYSGFPAGFDYSHSPSSSGVQMMERLGIR